VAVLTTTFIAIAIILDREPPMKRVRFRTASTAQADIALSTNLDDHQI
jgi:hypothetical protein